jgi:hypothetical protein
MKYDYAKLYNEHWQKFMDECNIESIGIIRKDKDGNKIWEFANVFADDKSPYDFCARIGYTILENLMNEKVESLDIQRGQYILVNANNIIK